MPSSPNASSSLPPIQVGTRLTNYGSLDLIVEGLAEGSYGLVVWGPNQAMGGQMTALKLLRPDLLARANAFSPAEGERLRRDFEHEALIWCHLWPHAAIVTAHALTRLPGWDNLPALELEYAPRGSLRQTLSEAHSSRIEHLSLQAALVWGQQIAAALVAIHQPDPACERPDPLIHCDLKPENVLLSTHGWAQLTDLGLTRAYAGALNDKPDRPPNATEDLSGEISNWSHGSVRIDLTAEEERKARVVRLRAALQAAGELPAPTAGDRTIRTAAAAGLATRSMRMPPLSPALLTALLAPHPATSASQAAAAAGSEASAGTGSLTDPGIGSRGPALGTPPYMPPEQWWGLDAVTPASDVYALGVLLFELFTGGRWSRTEKRALDEDDPDPPAAETAGERYVRFPHAPQFTAEARAYQYGFGGVTGQQAYVAAWYAAHRAGPRWRLDDPIVGALTRGPLAELNEDAAQAAGVLQALSDLIADCLAPKAAQRPTAADVQRRLGVIARLAGQKPLVIPDVAPHTPQREAAFWANLAVTYGNIGQNEERLRLQQRVVALDPENPQRWMNLGAAYNEQRRSEQALAAFTEAERRMTPAYQARDPQRSQRLALNLANNQGVALADLGRFEEAATTYRRALALHPDATTTRINLAVALLQWSEEAGATREQRLGRLHVARQEVIQALAEAPAMAQGRDLLDHIERALADLGAEPGSAPQ